MILAKQIAFNLSCLSYKTTECSSQEKVNQVTKRYSLNGYFFIAKIISTILVGKSDLKNMNILI